MAELGLLMTYFQQETRAGRSIVRVEPENRRILSLLLSKAAQVSRLESPANSNEAKQPVAVNAFETLCKEAQNKSLQDFGFTGYQQHKSVSQVHKNLAPFAEDAHIKARSTPASFLSEFASATKRESFEKIVAHLRGTPKPLGLEKCRDILVPPVGNLDAVLAFVGEAPGADEEEQGEPFVGRAGELLTKMIQAMGLSRKDVFICNVLLHRPAVGGVISGPMSGNRPPSAEEMRAGLPQLLTFLDLVRPKVVVTLGLTAFKGLFSQPDAVMSKVRGQWHELNEPYRIAVMPTYHPAYLLRNPVVSEKRKVWEDLLMVMERLGLPISDKQRGYFTSIQR